jgi:DNA-binding transcriptional LysR family regulator
MKVLESEVGFPLFLASGRGIVISDEGMRLYKRAGPFLTELDRLLGKSVHPPQHLIRIGSSEVFTCYFTGKLLKNYIDHADIEIHELIPGRLEESLILDKIDIGITYEPIPHPGIEYVKITTIPLGAYHLKGTFAHQDLSTIPFVVQLKPLESIPSGAKGLDGWPTNLLKRTERYRVDLLSTGLELVRQGLCAIFIPRFVAEFHNKSIRPEFTLEPLKLPVEMQSIQREIYIIKRESTVETKAIKQVARALRAIHSQ